MVNGKKVTRKIIKFVKFNVEGWINPYINLNTKYREKKINRF